MRRILLAAALAATAAITAPVLAQPAENTGDQPAQTAPMNQPATGGGEQGGGRWMHGQGRWGMHGWPMMHRMMMMRDARPSWQTTAHNQAMVNEAEIACALERYHHAHGEYPKTLEALVPQYIEKLPHDIIGGQPLHYCRTSDGKFLLYSVGWDERDDGGTPGTLHDPSQGDWVWKN